jgi:hypothetical protein
MESIEGIEGSEAVMSYETTTWTLALVTGEFIASSLLSRRSTDSRVLPDSVNLNGSVCTLLFSVCLSFWWGGQTT